MAAYQSTGQPLPTVPRLCNCCRGFAISTPTFKLVYIHYCSSPPVDGTDMRAYLEDESGWSPLMIAANVQDSEEVLNILLRRDADVNQKSMRKRPKPLSSNTLSLLNVTANNINTHRLQWTGKIILSTQGTQCSNHHVP